MASTMVATPLGRLSSEALPQLQLAQELSALALVPRTPIRRKQQQHENAFALRSQSLSNLPAHVSDDVLVRVLADDDKSATLTAPGEPIQNLTLRLNLKKHWFKSKDCLLYGGREMLENKHVRDVVELAATTNDHNYLHVFVNVDDVRSVDVNMALPSSPVAKPRQKSALTASLGRSISKRSLRGKLPERSPKGDQRRADPPTALDRTASGPLRAPAPKHTDVIHLIVRKSAHVSWQHVGTGQFELTVRVSDTAGMVKERISSANGLSSDRHALVFNGFHLDSNKPLSEYGVGAGGGPAVLELVPLEPAPVDSPGGPLAGAAPHSYPDGSPMLSSPAHSLFMPWKLANGGLRAGRMPSLASSGSGGSYFMHDAAGAVVAVFKPGDEEPNASNNPRGFADTASDYGMRLGIQPGEGAWREVAAYVLDHDHRAGVPATAMVYADMPEDGVSKYGSLQAFVVADSDCEEIGVGAFPVEEVHKIAILDCRIANTDRNASNILARKEDGTWRLFPIDHGYCLPATLEDITFEWCYWPQARQPFSAESRAYIKALDADYDLTLLRERMIPLSSACARNLKACTLVLKRGAARGLSPHDIAMLLQRPSHDVLSPLEKLHLSACAAAVREESAKARKAHASSGEADVEFAIVPFAGRQHIGQPRSDTLYISHLSRLLDAYLEETLLDRAAEEVP